MTGPRRHVAESLRKGHRVFVTGRLITRSWTDKNDQTGYRIEIADEIAPSLRWATATITKATRTNGKSPAVDPSNLSDDDIPFENCAAHRRGSSAFGFWNVVDAREERSHLTDVIETEKT